MIKSFFLALLFVLPLSHDVLGQAHSTKTIQSFNWLIGKWKMQSKNGLIYEQWRSNGKALAGISYTRKSNGDSITTEAIQLAFEAPDFYYIPTTMNQNDRQ